MLSSSIGRDFSRLWAGLGWSSWMVLAQEKNPEFPPRMARLLESTAGSVIARTRSRGTSTFRSIIRPSRFRRLPLMGEGDAADRRRRDAAEGIDAKREERQFMD